MNYLNNHPLKINSEIDTRYSYLNKDFINDLLTFKTNKEYSYIQDTIFNHPSTYKINNDVINYFKDKYYIEKFEMVEEDDELEQNINFFTELEDIKSNNTIEEINEEDIFEDNLVNDNLVNDNLVNDNLINDFKIDNIYDNEENYYYSNVESLSQSKIVKEKKLLKEKKIETLRRLIKGNVNLISIGNKTQDLIRYINNLGNEKIDESYFEDIDSELIEELWNQTQEIKKMNDISLTFMIFSGFFYLIELIANYFNYTNFNGISNKITIELVQNNMSTSYKYLNDKLGCSHTPPPMVDILYFLFQNFKMN